MIVQALRGDVQLMEFRPSTNKRYKVFRVNDVSVFKMYNVVSAVSIIVGSNVLSTCDQMEMGMLINQHIPTIIAEDTKEKRYDGYRPELFQ